MRKRCVCDGEVWHALLEEAASGVEQPASPARCSEHRLRRGRRAWRRLSEGSRSRGLNGDVSLDLLHQLMDVAAPIMFPRHIVFSLLGSAPIED
jgi:hypothetical protein